MNLTQVLELFYKAEQNVELSCFFDMGWEIRIGDPINGYKEETDSCYDLKDAADWLMQQYEKLGLEGK